VQERAVKPSCVQVLRVTWVCTYTCSEYISIFQYFKLFGPIADKTGDSSPCINHNRTFMSAVPAHACAVCHKGEGDTVSLMQCSRCKTRYYCGKSMSPFPSLKSSHLALKGSTCQQADWPTHKGSCNKPSAKWHDKHRKCQDGSNHEGRLELITWSSQKEGTGWGCCFEEESDDLRRKFETEFNSDEEKMHEYWPQGFRWTCCGTSADMDWGCDHHGSGSRPCTCDFCRFVGIGSSSRYTDVPTYSFIRSGKPLPDSIYNDGSASRMGLQLRRGPDPRSFNRGLASLALSMRTTMGLEM